MSQVGVDARRDEFVRGAFRGLHDMVETLSSSAHRHTPHNLPYYNEREAGIEDRERNERRQPPSVGKKVMLSDQFEEREAMRSLVRNAIRGEEERGDLGLARIVGGSGPELEVVEEGEDGDEEGAAPERRVGAGAQVVEG